MDLNISFTKLFFFFFPYRIIFLFALFFFPFEDVNCFVLNAKIFLFISICFPVSNKLRYSLKNKSTFVQWPGW